MHSQAQSEVLNTHQDQLQDKQIFKADLKTTRNKARSTMYGNSRMIKRLNKVDFSEPVPSAVNNQVKVGYTEDSKRLSKSVKVHPQRAEETRSIDSCKTDKDSSSNSSWGPIFSRAKRVFSTTTGIYTCGKKLYDEHGDKIPRSVWDNINKFKANVSRAFKNRDWNELDLNGRKVFENLQTFELDQLSSALQTPGYDFDPDLTDAILRVSMQLKCKNATEFAEVANAVVTYVDENARNPLLRALLIEDLKKPNSKSYLDFESKFKLKIDTFNYYVQWAANRLPQENDYLEICQGLLTNDVNAKSFIFSKSNENAFSATFINNFDIVYTIVIHLVSLEEDMLEFNINISILKSQ